MNNISLARDVPLSDFIVSFWLGFRFDALVLSIIILPLFVTSLVPVIRFTSKLTRKIYSIILTVIFSPIFLLCIADLRFFDNFGSRLNYWAIEYIEFPKMFVYTIVTTTGFWLLISLWIIMTIIFFLLIKAILRSFGESEKSPGKLMSLLIYLIMTSLLVFGIRGRTGIKPLDWGEAYFSDNHFINQMSLNSIYTLGRSIDEERENSKGFFDKEDSRFSFYDIGEAYRTVAGMLGLELNDDKNNYSLSHQTTGKNRFGFSPNIIIIVMESWSADKIGSLGSELNISPEFDKLCQHGILFNNFYANGIRTNRGLAASLCSFPSLPGRSIMKRYAANYPFRSIAEILDDKNYSSIYAYGGDIQFDNMKGFFKSVGYNKFYEEDDFDYSDQLSRWGIPDHILFKKLVDDINKFERPFNLSVMTLSFHDPYLIPGNEFKIYPDSVKESKILNCFYYSDWAIGQFIDSIKTQPVFDSTIFIFTADHVAHQSGRYPLSPERFHIPLLIYSPNLLGDSTRVISATGSQVDIIPTVIGLLGQGTSIYSWGRDLLSLNPDDSGFAVIVADDKLGLVEGSTFMFHWVDVSKSLYDLNSIPYLGNNLIEQFPDKGAIMEQKLDSYIELANYLSRARPEINR